MVIQEASVEAIGRYNCAANNGVTNDDGEPIVDSVDVDIKVTGLYSSSAYTSFIIRVSSSQATNREVRARQSSKFIIYRFWYILMFGIYFFLI